MKYLPIDLSACLIRAIQLYPCGSDIEGLTFALEYQSLCRTYWTIAQGKFQPTILSTQPDFQIKGTLSQWMELLYNPLSPVGGCTIEGDPAKLQSLKENLTDLVLIYRERWDAHPFLSSLLYNATTLIARIFPDSPWVERADYNTMGIHLKDMYQRLDKVEWALKKRKSSQ